MSSEKTQPETRVQSIVHTPEPWKLLCDEARGRPRCLVVDSQGSQIAEVNPHRESWNEDSSLIAAAPIMAKALVDAIRLIRHLDGNPGCQVKALEAAGVVV